MIHFNGTEAFTQSPAELFGPLSDAGWLATAVPEAEMIEASPERAVWKLKPKLSFLTGSLETTLAVTSREPDQSVTFKVNGRAVGSGSTVVASLVLETEQPKGTIVRWTGEITELNGLLKMVPKGLIQAAAQKIIIDVWAAIRAKLG
ncbi:MAG: SRPBCC domain-containing protein [Gemmataceae bacterium]